MEKNLFYAKKLENPFWPSTKLTIITPENPKEIIEEYPLPLTPGKEIFFWNSQGLSYQCHEVRRCIRNGTYIKLKSFFSYTYVVIYVF